MKAHEKRLQVVLRELSAGPKTGTPEGPLVGHVSAKLGVADYTVRTYLQTLKARAWITWRFGLVAITARGREARTGRLEVE